MIIQGAANAYITGLTMNGADPVVVSSSVLNLNLGTNANAYLSQISFLGNTFSGTKAIVTQGLLNVFQMTNSSFSGDKLLQNTNYIDIQQAMQLSITTTNF